MKKVILLITAWIMFSSQVSATEGIEKTGDYLQLAIPAVGIGMVLGKRDTEGAWQIGKSFLVSTLATHGLKRAINRKRPNGGKHSFPSGHTCAAFTGAAFLQRRYGWNYGGPAYAAALFVGWSRVEANKHHVTDVLAGAALGILSPYLFTKPFEDKDIQVALFAENETYGLRVNCLF